MVFGPVVTLKRRHPPPPPTSHSFPCSYGRRQNIQKIIQSWRSVVGSIRVSPHPGGQRVHAVTANHRAARVCPPVAAPPPFIDRRACGFDPPAGPRSRRIVASRRRTPSHLGGFFWKEGPLRGFLDRCRFFPNGLRQWSGQGAPRPCAPFGFSLGSECRMPHDNSGGGFPGGAMQQVPRSYPLPTVGS